MDEAEKDEAIKRYNNPLSFWYIISAVQVVAVVAFVGYWSFPATVNLLQEVTLWFDWFRLVLRNIFFVFVFVNALIALIYYVSFRKTAEKNKPDLYDQYFAAVPSVVRTSPECNYRVTEVRDNDGYYNHYSNYKEMEPAFQAVKAVDEESDCYDRVVKEVNSKSYRRTRSEKKAKSTVEYRRTESERKMKTASWKSQTMDGLSSEEFRMTVETFITEKKKMLLQHYGVVDHCQNGVVDQWQNGAVDQWQNGVPEQQYGVVPWQNGVVRWQGVPDDDGTGGPRHRSRRLVGGSGSTGSGSYLAISN